MKTETLKRPYSHLLKEIQYFKLFESFGFPRLHKQGISLENEFVYMVTDLLGPTLEDLFRLCGRKFSLKTTLMLFYQMLDRVGHIHDTQFIHKDIKPENMLMGMGDDSNTLFLIDYGISRSFIDPKTNKHIPFVTYRNLVGTCRYVSYNSHKGFELSRRDDLISIGYVAINWVKGKLPWTHLPAKSSSRRYSKIGNAKHDCSNAELCSGLPKQFKQYMDYVMGLDFEAGADFDYMRNLVL